MKSEERKLIKFSNYSLCVTLPKWVIKDLSWQKGDVVQLVADSKKGEILIHKDKTRKAEGKTKVIKEQGDKKARW